MDDFRLFARALLTLQIFERKEAAYHVARSRERGMVDHLTWEVADSWPRDKARKVFEGMANELFDALKEELSEHELRQIDGSRNHSGKLYFIDPNSGWQFLSRICKHYGGEIEIDFTPPWLKVLD